MIYFFGTILAAYFSVFAIALAIQAIPEYLNGDMSLSSFLSKFTVVVLHMAIVGVLFNRYKKLESTDPTENKKKS